MTDQQQSTDTTTTQNIAQAIQEVSDRATLLVREEIELAKVEMTEKVTKLIKGAVVGIAAGIFMVFALIYLLHGFAWLTWYELFPDQQYFWGFFVVAAVLLLLGALAGFIAARAMKSGAPPTPAMAIDEAKLIKETVQSKHPERTI
ncbi:MAG TPA: phage holin family protein [Solirubrobacteraceae bacterium]